MMDLATASRIVDATLEHARDAGFDALAVVVLDAGGHVVVAKREDGASLFRIDIATGKATGALGMGFGTRELARRAGAAPAFYQGLMAMTGAVLPSPGGVLVRGRDGALSGAIGVSGDTGDNDEAAALAGIASVELVAQPGAA